jgi:hypothetical protein
LLRSLIRAELTVPRQSSIGLETAYFNVAGFEKQLLFGDLIAGRAA